jgi:Tfp pilus assembly protein PilO
MSSKVMYYILLAVTILLGLGVLGVGYGANMILSDKSADLSKLKATAQVTNDLQTSLAKDRADIKKYSELNIIAQTIVPQDKDQSETVREIVKIANQSGIARLASITFPASQLGANAKGSADSLSQLTPVKGINGVYLLPITVTVNASNPVTYDQFMTFLRRLENNRRTAQISDISIKPDSKNQRLLSFSLVVNEYIKP